MMGKMVLVVEDSTEFRFLLQRVLEAGGYSVDLVENGSEALEYLRTHPLPDLMVVDLHMPVMDGAAFCAIREQERDLRAIPVLLYSSDPYVIQVARRLHANGAISKTASSDDVLTEVRRCLH